MRLKSLKSITLGKQKKEPDKDDDKFKSIASDRIANMEKRIQGRTKDLEKKTRQIQELSPESDISELNGDIPKGPHGPLSELTLENDEKLDEEVNRLISTVLSSGPNAVTMAKELVSNVPQMSPDEFKPYTAEMIAKLRKSDEGQEGMDAFLNKRKPNWVIE